MPAFAHDAPRLMQRLHARHGPVFRIELFGRPMLIVGEPSLIREVLLDKRQEYSSRLGWHMAIGALFEGGLMLRDFEDHRAHRDVMQFAFRPQALAGYMSAIQETLAEHLDSWMRAGRIEAYSSIKRMTLDMAARVFLGIEPGARADELNRAFVDAVAASLALVRHEVPGLAYRRGMRGRRLLQRYFATLVEERRGKGGSDLFSQLCAATSVEGERLRSEEIVDHMIFLMMAAHDTTTSSLTATLWAIARHPEWQWRLGDAMRAAPHDRLQWEQRDDFPEFDLLFQEALRLFPPVPFLGRRSVRDTTLGPWRVPRNTTVSPSSMVAHMLPEYWCEPERFDPDRFGTERAEQRGHSHCYVPFGGGAHTCLGMSFAKLQVRAIIYAVLRKAQLELPLFYKLHMQAVPIPRPRGGLPLELKPRRGSR